MGVTSLRVRVAVLLLGSVGCSRTPPEPAPVSSTSSPTTTVTSARAASSVASATTAAPTTAAPASPPATAAANPIPKIENGRCLASMPATAPAIPAAASPPACPPDPEPNLKMPEAVVAFPDTPGNPRVDVELAKNEHDIQRGLMYRQSMPEGRGMLFKLDERRDHTFWMHNTCIPLDMMFVDDDGTIVGIVESARPLDDATRSVGCPSSYVLEVNAGWSRRHGVAPGQKLGLPKAAR